jgi:hypothetical protein
MSFSGKYKGSVVANYAERGYIYSSTKNFVGIINLMEIAEL